VALVRLGIALEVGVLVRQRNDQQRRLDVRGEPSFRLLGGTRGGPEELDVGGVVEYQKAPTLGETGGGRSQAIVDYAVDDIRGNGPIRIVTAHHAAAPDNVPVTITLNAGVRWGLKLTAGNTETTVNLTQSKLVSLELAGGAHVFELALPPVTGNLPLRVTHGMNQLKIKTNGVPVRVRLDVGAGTVIIDGETHTGVKPGTVLTSDGWAGAANRVDLDSVEGVGTLTVDTR
jgi:hypothetical protein